MATIESENQFEKNKNVKAAGLTLAITAAVFLIFFLISWTIPQLPAAPVDLGVEVNLGNSDQGLGTVAPQLPGEPSQAEATTNNPPPPAQQVAETQPEVLPNNDENATPVNTSPKPEKKTPKNTNNTIKVKRPKLVTTPAPPSPPKPKAVYKGGKSTAAGGNNADSYNKSQNQGIAGGKGDQGKPNGNPNSDSYTGNGGSGKSGISIADGLSGRKVGNFHFEDSYSHGGTVLVRVTVDENGRVTDASLDLPSGNDEIDRIAVRRARQVTFSKGPGVQTGRLKIRFENPKG
jgi:TonB family protein